LAPLVKTGQYLQRET